MLMKTLKSNEGKHKNHQLHDQYKRPNCEYSTRIHEVKHSEREVIVLVTIIIARPARG